MKEYFEIGIVTGVHGVRGDMKVFPYSNDLENLCKQKFFMIDSKHMEVSLARVQGKFLIVHLKGIETCEAAMELKSSILCMNRENSAPLPKGHYYMIDLIGCNVYENDNLLGVLDDIIETGANDVYSVISKDNIELLIPALKNVILSIDIEKSRIDVLLPEGLVDDEYI